MSTARFPRPREAWSAPFRFRAIEPAGRSGAKQHVIYTEWECQECGAVVRDTKAHRAEHLAVSL